jgi:hypothetical protein
MPATMPASVPDFSFGHLGNICVRIQQCRNNICIIMSTFGTSVQTGKWDWFGLTIKEVVLLARQVSVISHTLTAWLMAPIRLTRYNI